MSLSSCLMLLLATALCLALAVPQISAAHSSTIDTPSRVEFHTPSGEHEPGCARSFLFAVPASTRADGSLRSAYDLNITVERFSQLPVISAQNPPGTAGASTFDYCYNSAYVPLFAGGVFQSHALLVRCQSLLNESVPYQVGPSYLVLAVETGTPGSQLFRPLSPSDVVFQPTEPYENYGTEDPRVVYSADDQLYYLFYSAVETEPQHAPNVMSRLSLATTMDPRNIDAWKKYGPIIANNGSDPSDPLSYAWSKSGALLMADKGSKSLLIFGDSSIENGVQTAEPSADFLTYTYNQSLFLPIRSDSFDSNLVEAGPPPLQLQPDSEGERDYFFIYNSARLGYPSAKPGWDTQYNVGFALLDGTDPDTILIRSDQPILSPELGWEIGVAPFLGLTPNVVFVEGARSDNGSPLRQDGSDRIVFWYGAADSTVGAATLTVTSTVRSDAAPSTTHHQHLRVLPDSIALA